jgi:hypothetical protein
MHSHSNGRVLVDHLDTFIRHYWWRQNIVCSCRCLPHTFTDVLLSANIFQEKMDGYLNSCDWCTSLMALQPLWAFAAFQSPDLYTIGRTPWTNDQLVAKPLPKYMTAQTQNKHLYTPNIHVLNGIRTHDHTVRASEDSLCFRPLGYSDRQDINVS